MTTSERTIAIAETAIADEDLARQLLEAHLSDSGRSGFHCCRNPSDPRDLVVDWGNGSRWGVEVTRLYQNVQPITADPSAKPVSSEDVRSSLDRFGKQLGEETEAIRSRDYTLFLSSPGPFSRWRRPVNYPEWKAKVAAAVVEHVRVGGTDRLEGDGYCLKPGSPGRRWTVAVDHGAIDVASTLQNTLCNALSRKAADLPKWNGTFTERWLLVLNCYPLADDGTEVVGIIRDLVRCRPECAGFDGVFWSGFPDRALTPIAFS